MPGIIGAAGLAEAAWFFGHLITFGALIVVGLLAFASLARESWWFAVAGLAIMLAVTCCLAPWEAWTISASEIEEDPDIANTVETGRILAAAWAGECVLLLLALGYSLIVRWAK